MNLKPFKILGAGIFLLRPEELLPKSQTLRQVARRQSTSGTISELSKLRLRAIRQKLGWTELRAMRRHRQLALQRHTNRRLLWLNGP